MSLRRLQKKMNNMSLTYGETIEVRLDEFMEDVVKSKFNEIEKMLKKN